MSEFSSDSLPSPGGSKERLLKRVRLLLLIVVVIVGGLGGYRIYQLTLAESHYAVHVVPELDLYGTGTGTLFDAPVLLEQLDYELFLGRTGELLLALPARAGQRMGELSVSGAEIQQEVEAGRVRGRLRWPGADPERLTIELGLAEVEADTIRHVLSMGMTQSFFDGRVTATLGVRNQNDDPVEGLQRAGRMSSVADRTGVYDVTASVDDLLWRLSQGDADYSIQASQAGSDAAWQLDFPLSWFLTAGDATRVITVEQQLVAAVLLPVPERLAPTRVVGGRGGWDGRLSVHGVDLDLVDRAFLVRGDRRTTLAMVTTEPERLVLSADAAGVSAGSYRIELESDRSGETVAVPQQLQVTAGLWWVAPAEGARVVVGEPLRVAWGSSFGDDQVLAEAGRDRNGDLWSRLAEGAGGRGESTWSTEGVDEGVWVLRLSMPRRPELSPRYRTLHIDPPPRLPVLLRFQKNGAPYGRIKELWIDEEMVAIGPDRMNTRLELAPGEHRWTAYEALHTYSGYIIVEAEDQIIDLELRD